MTDHRRPTSGSGLPPWLTATVVLTVLAMMVYTIVVVGPPGYPITMMLGGLLGAYSGVDQLLKLRGAASGSSSPPREVESSTTPDNG